MRKPTVVTKAALVRRVKRLEQAIRWACGEIGTFPDEPPPLAGKYRQRYHWRKELRKRAGLSYTLPKEAPRVGE